MMNRAQLSPDVVEAAIELKHALVARAFSQQAFLASTGAEVQQRQTFARIPDDVRQAGERVTQARIALEALLVRS